MKVFYSYKNKKEVYVCRCIVYNIVVNKFSLFSFEKCVYMEFLDCINDFDVIFMIFVNRYSVDLWLLSLIFFVGVIFGVN